MSFSVVIPVKDEIYYVKKNLPRYFMIGPSEVIVCTDKPISGSLKEAIDDISLRYPEISTSILEVERDPDWLFHQAHVRREGFARANNNIIVTGDIDLSVNSNIHKAINLIVKEDLGLVSLSKLRYPRNLRGLWSLFITTPMRRIIRRLKRAREADFSGLYAFYKPYWLETEDEEKVKRIVNPRQIYRKDKIDFSRARVISSEDGYLRDQMKAKYRVVYLPDVGAVDYGSASTDAPYLQFMMGRRMAMNGKNFYTAFLSSFLRASPHYLIGYFSARAGSSSPASPASRDSALACP